MNAREVVVEAGGIALRAAPGGVGSAWTLADGQVALGIAVGVVTFIFVVLQIAYFLWKWRRNAKTQGMIP